MDDETPRLLRAFRRSRDRRKVLLALSRRGQSDIPDLARETALRWERASAALFGSGRAYRKDFSLVALGCAELAHTSIGRVARITPLGRDVAKLLAHALETDPNVRELSDLASSGTERAWREALEGHSPSKPT